MMIDKRLINIVPESKKYIVGDVLLRWLSLLANIIVILSMARLLQTLYQRSATPGHLIFVIVVVVCGAIVRFLCTVGGAKMSHLSAKTVKIRLRHSIYQKMLQLGVRYQDKCSTSQVVQVAVEGIDQLETYFGSYLPQLFYSMVAPLTLFIVLSFINIGSALILLVCVPLIPITIAAVQTFAKKLLSKYWGEYTTLGDSFLENLQGLTTLKIYQADERKQIEMNQQAEHFRKITMKVLTMQLNSITIMDAISYGGAALGIILAGTQLSAGAIDVFGAVAIILLSADFYIPMRLLGSFFHIAMNGMAAKEKIFQLLDTKEDPLRGNKNFPKAPSIICRNLSFSYDSEREILHSIDLQFPVGSFTSIVGESGSGKSTIASILTGRNANYGGSILVDNTELRDIAEKELLKNITYIGFDSYIFKGTVRENLCMGAPNEDDSALWNVLKQVNLADFLQAGNGLDTILSEKGINFSGGQRQRLALARSILHNSQIYIFDEVTSNVDVESETAIMKQIYALRKNKTIILITHRMANTQKSDNIYVIEDGIVKEATA